MKHDRERQNVANEEKSQGYFKRIPSDQLQIWQANSPLLVSLDLELTERCNNNCIHCYINLPLDDSTAKKRELSTGEVQKILEEAASLGCLKVRFTGGEPLVRKDFAELYLFARNLGLRVLIFTNGTLITSKLARLFAEIPPLEKIEVSLYGMRKSSYEGVTRTVGSFAAAWRGIEYLLQAGVPFGVRTVVLPPNEADLEPFEAWAATIPWMDEPSSHTILLDLRGRREPSSKNRFIKQLRTSPEKTLSLFTRNGESYVSEMRVFCSRFVGPDDNKLLSCGAGVESACVDPYGHLQPCMMLRHPTTVYDLQKGSLREAMTDFFPKLLTWRASNHDYLARCGRCFLSGLCEQCPAKSWLEHGTLDTPVDYFCEIAHAQARFLGLLQEGERGWEVENWRERIENFSDESRVVSTLNQCYY